MGRGTHRGFITYEELNKSLGKRNLSNENLAQAFIHILDEHVTLVEKKSDYKVLRKKENSSKEDGKTIEKSDDPIRMYLREMGGVELLSREGEIAIAKRIEAGKDVMLIALSQSPITAQQFFEWNDQLQKDEILVREIIDIDTNYMEDENTGQSAKQKKTSPDPKEKINTTTENIEETDDEFNPTLAAMENEIKPKILLACDGYLYAGKRIDRMGVLTALVEQLPTIKSVLILPYLTPNPDCSLLPQAVLFDHAVANATPIAVFRRMPFNAPLYILYSSDREY